MHIGHLGTTGINLLEKFPKLVFFLSFILGEPRILTLRDPGAK
jgi:hypothetical protein